MIHVALNELDIDWADDCSHRESLQIKDNVIQLNIVHFILKIEKLIL